MDKEREKRLAELFAEMAPILTEAIGEAMASDEFQRLRTVAKEECECLIMGYAIEFNFSSNSLNLAFSIYNLAAGKKPVWPQNNPAERKIRITNEDRTLAHEMHIRLNDSDTNEIESTITENVSADLRNIEEIIQSIRKFALRLGPAARRIISDFLNQEKVNKAFGVTFPKDETIENDEIFLGSIQEIINRIRESARGAENIKNMLISFENVVLSGFRQE